MSVSVRIPVSSARTAAATAEGSEPDYVAAVFGPGQLEGAPGGGFPGASRGDRELQPYSGAAHLADQCGLSSIEGKPRFRAKPGRPQSARPMLRRDVLRWRGGAVRRRGSAVRCRGRLRRRCRPDDPSTRRKPSGSSTPSGAPMAIQRRSSTSSTNRSTTAAACSPGTSMVRTCRWASARTCHICQVDRVSTR